MSLSRKAQSFPLPVHKNSRSGEGEEHSEEEDASLRPPSFAPVDMSSGLDMASWKTNSGFGMYDDSGFPAQPPPGVFGKGMPPMFPGMFPGMPPGMPPFGMPGMPGWPMPNGMSMPNASLGTAEELEARAADLELQAAQLKMAARQAELTAQQMKSGGHMAAMSDMQNGYAGSPAMIAEPTWSPAVAKSKATAKKDKPKKEKTEKASSSKAPATSIAEGSRTTIMLRNIPNNYTREMVLELLDGEGFKDEYDFIYLPMDFHRMAGLGYAFVNLVSNEAAERAKTKFQGFDKWTLASQKVCDVSWGEPLQGLEAHIERYRNSPVMHEDVKEIYKPVLLKDGVKIPFPEPTKKIRPPRVKRSCAGRKNADDGGGDDAFDD